MKQTSLLVLLWLTMIGCQEQASYHLRKKVIKKIYPGVVEVLIPKLESDAVQYSQELPRDKQSFKERNDDFHAIGTGFFVSEKKLLSAAHVFGPENHGLYNQYYIRTTKGEVFKIKDITKYDQYRDFIEFDLEKYPKNIHIFELGKQIEIGDMVYTIGNAQGEGISTRGGQISAFTKEPHEGVWDYIRFSSPASPGNSGGPLVNRKGEVVGLVVMKNSNENLNYALPFSEFKNVKEKKALFFERNLKVYDKILTLTRNWNYETDLPSDLEALRKKAIQSKGDFYTKLLLDFRKQNQKNLFPKHFRFRHFLRTMPGVPHSGSISSRNVLNTWYFKSTSIKQAIIDENTRLYHGKGEIFDREIIFDFKNVSLSQSLLDAQKLSELFLTVYGPYRQMAGEKILITSFGPPLKEKQWQDRLGRRWVSYFWEVSFNNTFMYFHCTPIPRGPYCVVERGTMDNLSMGQETFLKENILEQLFAYQGSAEQWKDFFNLPQAWIPKFLKNVKVEVEKMNFHFKTQEFDFNLALPEKGPIKIIRLELLYDLQNEFELTPSALQLIQDARGHWGFTWNRFFAPGVYADEKEKANFIDLKEKTGAFDGKVHGNGARNSFYLPPSAFKDYPFKVQGKEQKIKGGHLFKCFSSTKYSKQWPKKLCSSAKIQWKN